MLLCSLDGFSSLLPYDVRLELYRHTKRFKRFNFLWFNFLSATSQRTSPCRIKTVAELKNNTISSKHTGGIEGGVGKGSKVIF